MAIYFNHALGFELPFYWLQNQEVVRRVKENEIRRLNDIWVPGAENNVKPEELKGILHFDEVKIKLSDEDDSKWWTLPLDPVISVNGKNTIIRRHVLKVDNNKDGTRRGTVKELWSQDDYEVNIAGVLIGAGDLPEEELRKLRGYMEARKVLNIQSRLLGLFGITRLAIEDYSLPFTKGMENQMYTIKGYSDDMEELLIEDE
ncbi:MAG: DUF6046 domain-containing protein [Prevotellaceae bacterium]|jgi:hypothetical protein|nr:DUF6046 domain-containing protein [Prevotellaceae bacterium]